MRQSGQVPVSRGLPHGSCCCILVMKKTMYNTSRVWPWCCLRQHRGYSLDGRHKDQGFSRSPSRPRSGRSAWMLSNVMSQQMTKWGCKRRLLQQTTIIQNCPRRNITIMMGNFNANIGSSSRGYEEIMGQHKLGEMKDNGERFTDLYALSNLVIGGSVFQGKRIHKATWASPDL